MFTAVKISILEYYWDKDKKVDVEEDSELIFKVMLQGAPKTFGLNASQY